MSDEANQSSHADVGPAQQPVGRPVPKRYYMRYLCDDYTLADAFRLDPGWGSRGYYVEAASLGEHSDEDIIRCARETAPLGFWLHHIEAIGGDPPRRDVFKKGVPLRCS